MTTGEHLVSLSTLSTGSALDHLINIQADTVFVSKFTATVKKTLVFGSIITPPSVVGDIKNKVAGIVTTKKSSGTVSGTVLTGNIPCKQ